jgi:hypothetical protein
MYKDESSQTPPDMEGCSGTPHREREFARRGGARRRNRDG